MYGICNSFLDPLENKKKALHLLGVFKKLGMKLDIRSFEKRLEIQKKVYMLQLNSEFRRYLGYYFNLFIRGPYSPGLARVYYNIPKGAKAAEINVSKKALDYGREIASMDIETLEIASTLIEVMKINRNIDDKRLVEHVNMLKPYYTVEKISKVLETVKALGEKYNLDFYGGL